MKILDRDAGVLSFLRGSEFGHMLFWEAARNQS